MIKVLELKGYKSLKALNAFHALILGLKMLPAYERQSYEDFYLQVSLMDEQSQEKIIREAAQFVELQEEEVKALITFCCDKNGVPYTSENLKSLGPKELVDIIVAVCMEIARIKVDLVTDYEKKKSVTSL